MLFIQNYNVYFVQYMRCNLFKWNDIIIKSGDKMAVSKSQMASNKKYDKEHFKYQSVKLKLSEYETLKKAIEISKMPMNTFLRSAIMCKVAEYVDYNADGEKD